MNLVAACSISIWDALIVASCINAEVRTLFSEDIHQHAAFKPLTVTNPFT